MALQVYLEVRHQKLSSEHSQLFCGILHHVRKDKTDLDIFKDQGFGEFLRTLCRNEKATPTWIGDYCETS